MNSYQLTRSLAAVARQGEKLLKARDSDSQAQVLWFASASDVLRNALPDGSALLSEFENNQKVEGNIDVGIEGIVDADEAKKRISKCVGVLWNARELVPLNLKDSESISFEKDAKLIIGDVFVRSPWFYAPIFLLVVTIAFAIAGVVQIQNVRVDLTEIAQKSIADAKAKIETQLLQIQKDLDDLAKTQKSRIETEADRQLNAFSPDLGAKVTGIQGQINIAGDNLNSLTAQATGLAQQVNRVEEATNRLQGGNPPKSLGGLSAALATSRGYLVLVSVVAVIGLLISGVNLFAWIVSTRSARK